MTSWKFRVAAVASAVVLLGATASVSAAQAQPNLQHNKHFAFNKLPKAVQNRIGHSKIQVVGNALLNADILIEVDNDAVGSLAAEGHLSLHKKKGTTYTGSFVDDLGSGHSYKASGKGFSATETTGKVTFKSHNGTFTLTYDNGSLESSGKAPKKYGSDAFVDVDTLSTHAYTTNPFMTAVFAQRSTGGYRNPIEGALTLTTDSLGFVVPHAVHGSKSAYAYRTYPSSKLHTSNITSWGTYVPADGANDGSLTISIKADGHSYGIVAFESDSNEDFGLFRPLVGDAVAGSGNSFFDTSFQAGFLAP